MSDTPELNGSDTLESLCAAVGATVGGTVASPFGIVIGGMAGRLLKRIIFNPDDFAYGIVSNLTSDAISGGFGAVSQRIQNRLKAKPHPAIGDALHAALSQALQAAVAELDGRKRSKTEVKNAPKVPDGVVYRNLASGSLLWKDGSGTGARIDNFFDALAKHVADPALLYGKVEAQTFLQTFTPNDTSTDFYKAVVTPVLTQFPAFEKDAPDFLKFLRAHLFSRTVAHLDTLIINDTGAWRTFNRLVLDEMRSEIGELHAGQAEITLLVTTILDAQNRVEALSTRLAEQLVALGQSEAMLSNSFDELYNRLDQWQAEQNRHFEKIHDAHARQDEKLDRIETKLGLPQLNWPLSIGLPFDRPLLVGREKLLTNVVTRLINGESVGLLGQGGIGKTALALAIGREAQIRAHFDGVLWASLGPLPNIAAILDIWAAGLAIDTSQGLQGEKLAYQIAYVISNRRILVILDDLWPDTDLTLLLCGGHIPIYLCTARTESSLSTLADKKTSLEVEKLSKQPAYKLLRSLAPKAWKIDSRAMQELAAAVDYIPLALELMGKFLAQPNYSGFSELTQAGLKKLADPQARLDLAQERLGQKGSKPTWAEVIELSLSGLPEEAIRTFYLLGAFAPQPARFDKEAAIAVTGSSLQTLSLLHDRSLLEIDEDGWLALHQTVAEVAKRKMEEIDADAVRRHRDHYLILAFEKREDYQRIEAAYKQIQYAWEAIIENDKQIYLFLDALNIYHQRRGLWGEREIWINRAISHARKTHDQYSEAVMLTNLGTIFHNQTQWERAKEKYEASLTIFRELGDQYHMAQTLNNLGAIYRKLAQWDKAVKCHEQALTIYRSLEDRRGEGHVYSNLGMIHDLLGNYPKAIALYEASLEINRLQNDPYEEGKILNNIGSTYLKLRRWPKAIELFKASLEMCQLSGGKDYEAEVLGNLGNAYVLQRNWAEAVKQYEAALLHFRMLGNQHDEGQALNNLGILCLIQGDKTKAQAYFAEALAKLHPESPEYRKLRQLLLELDNEGQ